MLIIHIYLEVPCVNAALDSLGLKRGPIDAVRGAEVEELRSGSEYGFHQSVP